VLGTHRRPLRRNVHTMNWMRLASMASMLMQPSACIVCYFVACSSFVLGFASSAVQSVAASLELGWQDITWAHVSDKTILADVVQEFCKHILNSDFGFLLLLNFFVSFYAFIGVVTSVSLARVIVPLIGVTCAFAWQHLRWSRGAVTLT
jgi:hypothetical protein